MDIVELWGRTIKDAVNRFAKNQPKEIKQDYEQECYLAVLVMQDVLERIISDQGNIAAKNYVYGTCAKTIHNLQKDTSKHQHESITSRETVPETGEPESVLEFEDHEIDEAIKHLAREEQHVIREIYFLGKTERDVAKALSKPKTWVHDVKQSALAQLRDKLR